MPDLVLAEGGVPPAAVAHVVPQRVVQILPVLDGPIGRRAVRAGRAAEAPLDLEAVEAEEVGALQVLDLLEEVEESRVGGCAFETQQEGHGQVTRCEDAAVAVQPMRHC